MDVQDIQNVSGRGGKNHKKGPGVIVSQRESKAPGLVGENERLQDFSDFCWQQLLEFVEVVASDSGHYKDWSIEKRNRGDSLATEFVQAINLIDGCSSSTGGHTVYFGDIGFSGIEGEESQD